MEPLTMAYLALMAASTAASYQAQRKTNKARTQVMSEERERRKRQQKQSDASARSTEEAALAAKAKESKRGEELAQQYQRQDVEPTTTAAGTRFLDVAAPINSTRTVEAIKDARARGLAQSNQQGAAQGRLQSFGDVMLDTSILTGRNAQDISRGNAFTQGWQQNVMPALFARANQAGRDWGTAADVMKLAAMVMGPMALGKGGVQAGMGTGTGPQAEILNARYGAQPVFGGFNPGAATGFAGASGGVGAEIVNPLGIVDPARDAAARELLDDPYWWARPGAFQSAAPDYYKMH